uniref:TPR repeat-containing protein MJ1345 n=1 Tax=Anthurium amnicola TaxID=1678845 RepID=A0A1D1YQ56_9ARAE
MSCAAIKLSLVYHARPQNPTNPKRALLGRTRSLSLLDSLGSQKPHLFPILTRPSNPHSPFPSLPISSLPRTACSRTPQVHVKRDDEQHHLLKSCVRTSAALLIGSLVFMGRFSCRPAFSVVDVQRSTSGAPMEEKVDTQKEEDEEVELSARILETNPKDVEALKMALYGKMKKGRTREAVEYVERLIDVEPDELEWRLLQALCYELMGRFSKAKQLFKGILEERPLLLRALHGLAVVMHRNHEGPAVFDMLDKALELARHEQRVTEERNIRILIAQMLVIQGDLEGGLMRFQKLAEENPRDFRPYLCQGIIYSLLDRKKEAEEQFEIYRSLVPDEFSQRGFLDDVILAAKAETQELLKNNFQSEFSSQN